LEKAAEITRELDEIEQLRDSLTSGASLVILPELFGSITAEDSEIEVRTATKLFGSVIRSGDSALSRRVFSALNRQIYSKIPYLWYDLDSENSDEKFSKFRVILSEAIQNKENKRISSRNIAISYYFYLVTLALDNRMVEYEAFFADFKDYVDTQEPRLSQSERKAFEADSFTSSVKSNSQIDSDIQSDMIEKIDSAWQVLVNG
jgi:hypothetical protein